MSTTIQGMLPSAPDIERAVLGTVLNRVDLDTIFRTIRPEWFHTPAHRTVFETAVASPGADIAVMAQKLADAGAGVDAAALFDLGAHFECSGQAERYAGVLRDKFLAREAALAGMRVSNAAMAGEDAVETATAELSRLVELSRQGTRAARTMRAIMIDMLDDIERRMDGDDTTTGFQSRFPTLNRIMGGIPRNYTVIGGETSAGKSALAQTLIEDVALTHGQRAVWYSLEMGEMDLAYRLAASRGGIDGQRIFNPRNHPLRQQDTAALTRAVTELRDADIVLRPTADITVEQIRSECRDYAADGNLGIVVVDYMQLLDTSTTDRNTTQEQVLSRISKRLLAISKELNTAVVALTQLNDQGRIRSCRSIGHDAENYLTIEEYGLLVVKNRHGARDELLPIVLDKPHFRFIETKP